MVIEVPKKRGTSLTPNIESPSQPVVAYLQLETDAPDGALVDCNNPGDGVELAGMRIKIGLSFDFCPTGRILGVFIRKEYADGAYNKPDEKRCHPDE